MGENTIQAAQRELWEETKLVTSQSISSSIRVKWHPIPFTSTDSIDYDYLSPESALQHKIILYHYVISQCFAEVELSMESNAGLSSYSPMLIPCDDAIDAKWWTVMDVREGVEKGIVSKGCEIVLERAEELYTLGLLHCF